VSEQIISSRTSGFHEYQPFAFFGQMLQFFHFYNDVLEWTVPVKFFLNPISPGSVSNYSFMLRDTIVSGVDSTFIISFQPRRSANFEGLKGLLHINSNGWAIQHVVAEPADYSPIRLRIQQSYELTGSVWFPSELSLELRFSYPNQTGVYGAYRGISRITEVDLSPDMTNRNIRARNITIAADAHLRHEIIDHYRGVELTAREDSTYRLWRENQFDNYFRVAEGFLDRMAIPINIFDFPFNKIISQNYTEGFRVGLGIYTNQRLSPWFSLGGYFGYGVKDRRAKYGTSFSFFPEKHLDSEIKLWYANDLHDLTLSNEAGISARKLWSRFDIETRLMVQNFQTVFDYSFAGHDMSTGWNRNAEAGFRLRYAHNEERAKIFRRTHPLFETRFPVIYLNLYFGLPNLFGSAYQYIKTEVGVERRWHIRKLGTATFSVWGGLMSHETPFPMTFTVTDTEQSLFHSNIPPDSRTRFNALTGDAYAANQYVNVFLYHDFGTLLGKTNSRVFRPRIAIAQSFGWSRLNRPERHLSADFNILDMRRGYFESGLMIEDIVRIEFLNMMFFGIGGGIYGAYGGSVQKPFKNTLTPKIRITASF
jgi:hypothetical protein